MENWKKKLNSDSVHWLLEKDEKQPGIRYFALRDILGSDGREEELRQARAAVMSTGPVPEILAAQHPDGYWGKSGPGYLPKYQGTVWQVVFLAQLGADGTNPEVKAGCEYALKYNTAKSCGFSMNGTSSAFIHCMAGNLAAALVDLGYEDDERLMRALEWQSRLITGEGVSGLGSKAIVGRYYSGTPGPLFACGANNGMSCAWGAIKAMLALSKMPAGRRTEQMSKAIDIGIEFLLSRDLAVADYPFAYGKRPSSSWFKFGYPIGYVTDVLQNLEVLATLGKASDPRLNNALEFILSKQDENGRWFMEYSYNGKMWVDIEEKGKPSKWVTLRALKVLKSAYPE
jgi:hypothetical protein